MISRAILLCSLALIGCGGPLAVTAGGYYAYDPISANAVERENVERAQTAAAEAQKKRDATAAAIEGAEERAEAAEETQTDVSRARLELTNARWRAEEAEKAWLVALAEVELAKHIAAQGKGADYEQLERQLKDQLADLKSQHAAAAKSLAASTQDLNESGGKAEANPYE